MKGIKTHTIKKNRGFCFNNRPKSLYVFSLPCLALGYAISSQATITPSQNQQQIPRVQANVNGSLTVNINTPSASGVSLNRYSQFDVNKQGVVLNNSSEPTLTTVAGRVGGNKNMKNGAASLIINEVISNSSSQLSGIIEVANNKADVIISNPSGITCDGCNFVNVSHGSLTTGKIQMSDGNLSAINVKEGVITFNGQGMDSRGADYTAILATSIKFGATLRANDLQIVPGENANLVYKNNHWVNNAKNASKNNIARLDVSALGGMYANKIILTLDQTGSGVKNSGIISSDTDLSISASGVIQNMGVITSNGNVNIHASDDFNNDKGKLLSQESIVINSKNISNKRGLIDSTADIDINTNNEMNTSKGILHSDGDVFINSKKTKNDAGLISANSINIVSEDVVNTNSNDYTTTQPKFLSSNGKGGLTAASDIIINSGKDIYSDRGNFTSESGTISLTAAGTSNLYSSRVSGNNVYLLANKIINGHSIGYVGDESIIINSLAAVINAKNDINITTAGQFGSIALLRAGHDVNISTGKDTAYWLGSGNWNTITAGNNINFKTSDTFTNKGTMSAGNDISISSPSFWNTIRGQIISGNEMNIQTTNFKNDGVTLPSPTRL